MNKFFKAITTVGITTAVLVGSVGGTADAYTEKRGNLTYKCKKNGTISAKGVKKGAKQMEKGLTVGNWGAFLANLSPGGFVYDISIIAAGNKKDQWIKAAAAGKSAKVDRCVATNAGNTNGQGMLSYDKVRFVK